MRHKKGNRFCGNVDDYVAADFSPDEWKLLPNDARDSLKRNGYVDGKAPEHLKTKKTTRGAQTSLMALLRCFLMAKKKPKSEYKIDYEKFGWEAGDLIHHRNIRTDMWALLTEEEKRRFESMGYVDGVLPEWDSLTDEQKKRFGSYRHLYDFPAD